MEILDFSVKTDPGSQYPALSDYQVAALVQFTEVGAANGCPFCKTRMATEFLPGERIVLVKGARSGCVATVSKEKSPIDGELLVHFDGESINSLYRVSYVRDEFLLEASLPTPPWMCEVVIADLDAIETAILRSLVSAFGHEGRLMKIEAAERLAATIWGRRLPISGEQIWPTLRQHGYKTDWELDFRTLYDFGRSLLLSTHGRKAIKKKLVKRISIGQ